MGTILRFQNDLIVMPGRTSNGEPTFPWKLHMVLEESERLGFQHIISWEGDRAFKVHDQKLFELHILKKHFKQTQYRSFTRQLNMYGFRRVPGGKAMGSYTHEFLFRGKSEMCCLMLRTKIKKKSKKGLGINGNGVNVKKSNPAFRNNSIAGTKEHAHTYLTSKTISTDPLPISSNEALLELSKVQLEPSLIEDIDSVTEMPIASLKNSIANRASLSCKTDIKIHDTVNQHVPCAPLPFDSIELSLSTNGLTYENNTSQQQQWDQSQLQYQLRNLSSQIQKLTMHKQVLLDQFNQETTQGKIYQDIKDPTGATLGRSPQLVGSSAVSTGGLACDVELDLDTIFDLDDKNLGALNRKPLITDACGTRTSSLSIAQVVPGF